MSASVIVRLLFSMVTTRSGTRVSSRRAGVAVRDGLAAPRGYDRRLPRAHAEAGSAVQQDDMQEEHHPGLKICPCTAWASPSTWRIGRAHRGAAGIQVVALVAPS